jgi:hypothetical protein
LRWLILFLSVAILGGTSIAAQPRAVEAQTTPCVFTLGFRTLHDMIPNIVGECIENEWHNAENGDGLQRTTNGLMVWRKIDNWTAFTDGYTTWINGPVGLQARLNTERFPWEPVAAPIPAPSDTSAGGTASGGTSGGGTTAPSEQPSAAPTINIDMPERVDNGETFTIALRAEDDNGIESMWWWASSTDDDDLRDTHTNNCRGATPCRRTWDVSTTDDGTITIHAMARDVNGQLSDEVTQDVRVRSAPQTTTTNTTTTTTTTGTTTTTTTTAST